MSNQPLFIKNQRITNVFEDYKNTTCKAIWYSWKQETVCLQHYLIRKTKTGRFYNISFKFDDQTRAGIYRENFDGVIKLAQFVDLNTGEWIN